MGGAPDRLNRTLIAVLGLLLLAASVAALLASFGVFGDDVAGRQLLSEDVTSFAERNAAWFWVVVGVVAALVALFALRWLLAQVRSDRVGNLELEDDPRSGSTVLHSGAVTGALEEEIESYRGVSSAKARLLHNSRNPDLALEVSLDDRADIPATRARIEQEAIGNARQALGRPDLPTELLLKPGAPARR